MRKLHFLRRLNHGTTAGVVGACPQPLRRSRVSFDGAYVVTGAAHLSLFAVAIQMAEGNHDVDCNDASDRFDALAVVRRGSNTSDEGGSSIHESVRQAAGVDKALDHLYYREEVPKVNQCLRPPSFHWHAARSYGTASVLAGELRGWGRN